MGNLGSKALAIFFIFFALNACGVKFAREINKGTSPTAQSPATLSGLVTTTNGSPLDLASITGSLSLTFGSDSCIICREEALEFAAYFQQNGGLPKNSEFLTILIGANQDDALDWKTRNSVTWNVAFEPGDSLFRLYCPQQETPCTITFNRITGQTRSFFRKAGVAEVEREIGPWGY